MYDIPSSYSNLIDQSLITGHFHVDDSYRVERTEGREDWLVFLTISGVGFVQSNDVSFPCNRGDIVVIKAGEAHQYGTLHGEQWNFMWVHFSTTTIEEHFLPADPLFFYSLGSDSMFKRVLRAFRKIISDSRERQHYWYELCLNSLREIFIILAQLRKHSFDPRIEEALYYLSLHMKEPIKISTVAKAIGLSPSRLSHLFKEQIGYSIIDYLNLMRIRQAALLLEHTSRTAAEVAYEVGFQQYNHFINQCKKWLSATPTQIRNQSVK